MTTEAPTENSVPAVAPATVDTTTAAAADTTMEPVFSCTIYGLSGWENAAKVERRLRDHGIAFKDVYKRKGVRDDTGTIYFESEQQMTEQMTKMAAIREVPTVKPTASANSDATASTDAADAAASTDATTAPVLTRHLFKVRAPVVGTRKRVARPSSPRPNKREFRSAKRAKVELKEGEVGYAEAAEEARSASEGEVDDEPTGRTSPLLVERTINDVVAPLWRKPYPEQLVIKRTEVKDLMQQTTRNWQREYGKALQFPHGSTELKSNGKPAPLFVKLEEIVGSPVTDAYRNKCEFSVGLNSKNAPAIGHLMGKYTEGTVTVESIADVPHVPTIAKSLSATLLEFIETYSADYKPYDKRDHTGFWRLVVVRNSQETKQTMLLVQVCPKEKTDEQMAEFRQRLVAHFESRIINNPEWRAANEEYDLKSLQLQLYDGVSNAAPESTPIELLYGKEACITERLMGLDFRVSQAAFFQINVPQTNVLYSIAADFASLPAVDAPQSAKDKTTLLDVCCGTGTIGLSLANRVGKIVGLELSASAVEDAKFNATANGIKNAYYYVGKAEDTLSAALADHVNSLTAAEQADHIVTAIVDPPRSGLHADVVRLLRRCPRIDRIVYVSCNPKTLMENLQRFVQPTSKRWVGAPFTAVKAVPVDMFPHTTHCEMVVLLERPRQKIDKFKVPTKQFAHQMQAVATTAPTEAAETKTEAAETTPTDAAPAAAAVEEAPATVDATAPVATEPVKSE